jgi:oligopeptide transport system substrate-binding protein
MRRHGSLRLAALVGGAVLVTLVVGLAPTAAPASAARDDVRIVAGEPSSYDPAAQGDVASAVVTAQLYESLTAFDTELVLRPALAESWTTEDDGRRVVFTLRDGLAFSDGTALAADDVVRSWLRVIDPTAPSPLASLLDDVSGAIAYRRGEGDRDSVGLRAVGDREVEVRLDRPVGDFPAIVASATFGIVPPGFGSSSDATRLAVSGGYRLAGESAGTLRLEANDRYWAGRPAIGTVTLVTDLGGRSPVDVFREGVVDYTAVSAFDAAWLAYDPTLGPDLREVDSLGLTYYGFDASEAPFDDVRVRRAFAHAVRWQRIAELASVGTTVPATSMVPPGIPGRSSTDFVPRPDPELARSLLAEAGFPNGVGFPQVTMMTGGTGHEAAIVEELESVLGVRVAVETMEFGPYFERLAEDPPMIWALSWVADYPGPNDFLGLLLATDRTNNYGRWSSAEFDAAIEAALEAGDPAAAREAYDTAESIVRDEAPVIPVEYGTGFALSAEGLSGAGQNGLGVIRMAGLAWAD